MWRFGIAALAAMGLSGCASAPGDAACSLAIEHVNLAPMDAERIVADQTVRIAGDRILSISPSGQSGPQCNQHVSGAGRYLLPGLNDMHVHVESEGLASIGAGPPPPLEDALYLYLAHGVTGIRVMSGAPDILAFRASGRGPAPRMLIASPMLAGSPPILPEPITRALETPAEAREAVNAYADAGYDLIKIRDNLAPEVLSAVIETARARGLLVDGHIPAGPNPFASGVNGVAHIDELSLRVSEPETTPQRLAEQLHACRCFVTSTLVIEQNVPRQLRSYDELAASPELRFVHSSMRNALWVRDRNPYLQENPDPAFFDQLLQTDFAILRALHERGVPILAGTDALIPMIIPGDSLHDELALLVDAGLTRYEAIRAATRTPAEVFTGLGDVGVLSPGRTANAILVDGNPFENLGVLRHPRATIIAGRYLDRTTMDAHLETIAERFAQPAN